MNSYAYIAAASVIRTVRDKTKTATNNAFVFSRLFEVLGDRDEKARVRREHGSVCRVRLAAGVPGRAGRHARHLTRLVD